MDLKPLTAFIDSIFFQELSSHLKKEKCVSLLASKPQSWSLLFTALSQLKPLLIIIPFKEAYILSLEMVSWGNEVKLLSPESEDLEKDLLDFYQPDNVSKTIYLATTDILNLYIVSRETPEWVVYKGERVPRDNFINLLHSRGFHRTNIVMQPKEYAIRGYILDIYEPVDNQIYRIEFDETDEIKDIRTVDLQTQISQEHISSFSIKGSKIVSNEHSLPFYKTIPEKYSLIALQKPYLEAEVEDNSCLKELNWDLIINAEEKIGNQLEFEVSEPFSFDSFSGQQIIITEYVNRVSKIVKESVSVFRGKIRAGFSLPGNELNVISDKELFGVKASTYPPPTIHKQVPVEILEGFERNSPIVHLNYGIGLFKGLKPVEIAGEIGEFLELEFAGGDKLYVPFDQLFQIRKYSGSSNYSLSSLDSKEWFKVKKSAEDKANIIASRLLEIYAERKLQKGYTFKLDEEGEEEFKKGFLYEETPDQLKTIQEVKADMGSSIIMDRLICGDVGYGKTEVALRASFQAVFNYKQVALLAPTTILAHQHYLLFKERFSPFPVNVGVLSSFVPREEIKKTLTGMKDGLVDIVIGTHSLLQKDILFKNLGLLVIDEEHKFGVLQKEKIKDLKMNVDTLSLSATPIPRTLKMSLEGIKEISLLYTPPLGRLEVKVINKPYDLMMVKEAIEREVKRGGQVFYVHNRIKTLSSVEEKLKKIVPQVSIGVAHGRMDKRKLENIMWKFYSGDIKVLLSTTIIESGLDIPQANTLIVEDAQNLGLSELYQLRGRVGRSNVRGYVYLLYSPKSLTREAEERLNAITENSGLGSGFRIAVKDMEIRGTGNFFGPEQHGNIVKVGLDLFTEMVVKRLKGSSENDQEASSIINVITDCQAYLPLYYIADEALRLYFYKKLSGCSTVREIMILKEELIDRFGKIPKEADNLFKIVLFKRKAEEFKAKELAIKKGEVSIIFDRILAKEDYHLFKESKAIKKFMVVYDFKDLV
ncbi:MAG: Transcription-repair-coupling factor [candidate division WS2 bacterium]|nr:Transcription-repair-coupling factor [Candidatus Psychracetigena formicireducens]